MIFVGKSHNSLRSVTENANVLAVISVLFPNVGTVVRTRLKLAIPTGARSGPPGVNGAPAL